MHVHHLTVSSSFFSLLLTPAVFIGPRGSSRPCMHRQNLEKPKATTSICVLQSLNVEYTAVQPTDHAHVFLMYSFQPRFGDLGTRLPSNSRRQECPLLKSATLSSKIVVQSACAILSVSVVLVAAEERSAEEMTADLISVVNSLRAHGGQWWLWRKWNLSVAGLFLC